MITRAQMPDLKRTVTVKKSIFERPELGWISAPSKEPNRNMPPLYSEKKTSRGCP
jgi:hypothetical protein